MTETGIELAGPTVGGRVSVLAWSGLESACRQILSLLFFLGTIRFLSPADLGVFSLGVALMGIFAIVIDEPIGEALVQKAHRHDVRLEYGLYRQYRDCRSVPGIGLCREPIAGKLSAPAAADDGDPRTGRELRRGSHG